MASAQTRTATGQAIRVRAVGESEDDAKTRLRAKAARLGLSPGELPATVTLADLLNVWLDVIVASRPIRPQTAAMYRSKSRRLQLHYGALQVADLKPARLQVVVNDMSSRFTPSEYGVLKSTLHQALRFAVLHEVLAHDPFIAVERPRRAVQRFPVSLTTEQLRLFRREFSSYVSELPHTSTRRPAQLTADLIMGLGGLRISEVLALRERDVDFIDCTVDLSGTLVHVKDKPRFRQDKLKSERQSRILRLEPGGLGMRTLVTALAERPAQRSGPDLPLIWREDTAASPWVDPATIRSHFKNVARRPAMSRALASTGLTPEQVTPHALRRSVATAVARATDIATASNVLGHADTRVAKQSYVTPTRWQVDLTALDTMLEHSPVSERVWTPQVG